MASVDLPPKDSPDLHFVIATDDELDAQQRAHGEFWAGALSLDAYLRRETHLFSQELTKDGGLTPWMLVFQPDPTAPRHVVCGCETIRKRALVARNGAVDDTTCHVVGSVFCPPKYRGRGYAGRMMSELADRLNRWQVDDGKSSLFSALYSDIGKEFYAARGWQPFPSTHLLLPASSQPTPDHVSLLHSQDIAELCSTDEKLIRKRLSETTNNKTSVAIIPDHRTMAWHHAREEFVSKQLYDRVPSVKGALVGETPGSRVWAYWTRVWSNPQEKESPNTLYILRLVVEDDAQSDPAPASAAGAEKLRNSEVVRAISAILQAAQSEAAAWNMEEVVVWNPTCATLAAVQSIDTSAEVISRETESITSLLWYGDGSWKDVEWTTNEKYGWN